MTPSRISIRTISRIVPKPISLLLSQAHQDCLSRVSNLCPTEHTGSCRLRQIKRTVCQRSYTAAVFRLQELGLISYARGHIVAMDRHTLEHRACECYAVVK